MPAKVGGLSLHYCTSYQASDLTRDLFVLVIELRAPNVRTRKTEICFGISNVRH